MRRNGLLKTLPSPRLNIPSIVYQHIDLAVDTDSFRDFLTDALLAVGDVKLQDSKVRLWFEMSELVKLAQRSCGSDNFVSPAQNVMNKLFAEARGAASDQPD